MSDITDLQQQINTLKAEVSQMKLNAKRVDELNHTQELAPTDYLMINRNAIAYKIKADALNITPESAQISFFIPIQYIYTTNWAKLLAEYDYEITGTNKCSNLTDVRIFILDVNDGVTWIQKTSFPISVVIGDNIKVEVTGSSENNTSVVDLLCSRIIGG